jgi:hypothetical protein
MASSKTETGLLLDTFGALKDKRTGYDDKWTENFKRLFMYKEYTEEEAEDILLGIKADIKQPRELSHIETKRPRIINTIFSYDPIARAIPRTEYSVDKAKAAEALTNQIVRKKLYVPFFHALTQALYTGTGIFGMGMNTVRDGNAELDDVFFEYCDIFGFYVPDGYLEIWQAPFIFRRMLKPRSYLEKHSDRYKNIDDIPKLGSTSEIISDSYYVERQNILGFNQGAKETNSALGSRNKDDDIIELVERWEPDRVYTVANRKTVIRDADHKRGFIPFYGIKNYPTENTFYGLSEFDMTGDTFEYQEESKNLRVDIMRRVAYPAVLVSDKAKIADSDLVIRPYQVIRTADMEGYREVQRAEVKKSLYDEEFIGKQDQENLTGLFSYIKGGDAPRAETATTGLMMKEAGMERINTTIFYNSESCLKPLFSNLFTMLKDNLKLGMWAEVVDESGNLFPKKLKQADIDGIFEWVISAFEIKSIADINLQQNMMSLYDRYQKSSNVNLYELDKLMAKTFNIKNTNDLLIKGPQKKILDTIIANKDFAQMMLQIVEDPQRIERFLQIMGNLSKPQQGQNPGNGQNPGQPIVQGQAGVNMESPVSTMDAGSREPIGSVGVRSDRAI